MNRLPPRSAACVAPVLAADVRNQVLALAEAGMLRAVTCGAAYHRESVPGRLLGWIDRLAGTRLLLRTENRCIREPIPAAEVRVHPLPELCSRAASLLGFRRNGPLAEDRMFAAIDRAAAKNLRQTDRLVLGREDCCLSTFLGAREAGITTVYDLPTAHHAVIRPLLRTEEEKFPGANAVSGPAEDYLEVRVARKNQELAAADLVLVASEFVRSGLLANGISPKRIAVIPYGCNPCRPCPRHERRPPVVLFVGHLSLRKGIPRLLAVWKRLGAYRTHTLRLVGKLLLAPRFLADYAGTFEHVPPVAPSRLPDHYAAARLFVFPSACDGFGLVLNEAISCGTPVIASNHTGAPGFLQPGVHGLIYPHGDDDQLAAHLDWMLSHPRETAEMGRAAQELAQSWGWPQYRAMFRKLVSSLFSKDKPPCPSVPGFFSPPPR